MTREEFIRHLRSGFDSTSNLLVQITSHAVIEDMDEASSPEEYNYPLLSAQNGILKIAQNKFVDTDGSVYHGGMGRCTGLGEVFNEMLTGESNKVSGSLDYQMDESPLMLEVRDVDWLSDSFDVRHDPDSKGWALAYELFSGVLLNGAEKDDIMSFRVAGLHKLLAEDIHHGVWIGNSVGIPYQSIIFGKIYDMPIAVSYLKSGADFVYFVGVDSYSLYDNSETAYNEDEYGDLVATPAVDYGASYITLTASDGWTLNDNDTPVDHCYATTEGYDNAAGYLNIRTVGSILKEATGLARFRNPDLSIVNILGGREIDTDSLDVLATKNTFICGINMIGYDLNHSDPDFPWEDVMVHATLWNWRTLFSLFTASSLSLYTINNDGSISFHYLYDAPTETPVLTLTRGDFTKYERSPVIQYDEVAEDSLNDNSSEFHKQYPERVAIYEGKFLAKSSANTTQIDAAKDKIKTRFGKHNYRFYDCLVAPGLNVGNVITFDGSIDSYLEGKLAYVKGGTRGTKPFLDIRA